MAYMREIRLRMNSINKTRQITRAMKLISAARLKKARQQLEETLPFFNKVKSTMADILKHSANIESIFFDVENGKQARKKGYVILTGDKGLSGGYNHNTFKFSEKHIDRTGDNILFVAGHMGRSHFLKKNYNVYGKFAYPIHAPTVQRAMKMAEIVLDMYKNRELDEVYLIFTKAHSSLKLLPQIMRLLPLKMESLMEDTGDKETFDESLVYEPSPAAVLDILIPKYLKGILYGALVEAFTCEQSARMTAMDNATANAEEMLQKLNLYYNRARQAAITQEISEIIGGATAVK